MKYRLEPIVDLLTNQIIGHELLAGESYCPQWGESEWRDWYVFLEKEVPTLLPDLPGLLFLNLDGYQLLDSQIAGSIRTLRDHARRIVIEWTEQHFHDEKLVDVLAKINFLKGIGFRLAIDDIGAGSGMDGLGRAGAVKANFCKIDGPYFQTIRDKGPEYLRGLCQHLSHGGARVIVEWIETEGDYRLALAAGAHLGQGYLWSRTDPAVEGGVTSENLAGSVLVVVGGTGLAGDDPCEPCPANDEGSKPVAVEGKD
ncbi:EAL domain-containing protein [Acidithiobacillus thiooxidans]|uniref:EAL domain-containing protein n=1 Tax=Acidithiobacillus thiooxidans TaxID=930 RepID=UPI001C07BBB9|nr:EAL domain-containing protein [Acidithiobacillus thiooxidans]MBU2794457.1 EAL domain-containing protein [Acidithiobacillus thiooxidans]